MRFPIILAAVSLVFAPLVAHAQPKKGPDAKPAPDVKDAKYGPHQRNVLDLWKAKSDKPTPLVVFIHGGGFRAGDKSNLAAGLLAQLPEGGHLGGGDQLPAVAARPLPGPDARRRPGHPVPPVEGEGVEPRPDARRGDRRLGRGGHLAVAGVPRRPGRPEERRPGRRGESTRLTCAAVLRGAGVLRPALDQEDHRRAGPRAPGADAVLRAEGGRARHAEGAQALRGGVADQLRHRRTTRRSSSSTPSRRGRCRRTPSRGRASTTRTSARR